MATVKKAVNFNKEDAEILVNYKDIQLSQNSMIFLNVLAGVFFILGVFALSSEFIIYLRDYIYYDENNFLLGVMSVVIGFLVKSEKKINIVKTYREK